MTLLAVVRRIQYTFKVHGFRRELIFLLLILFIRPTMSLIFRKSIAVVVLFSG